MKNTKMLKKNYEFKTVLTKGKFYSGKYIEIFIKKNYLDYNFLGLAISSKAGIAVQRNHIKRLIREIYKIYEDKINVGYSIVILWKKKANFEDATFNNIKKDMEFLINKSNIKKEK